MNIFLPLLISANLFACEIRNVAYVEFGQMLHLQSCMDEWMDGIVNILNAEHANVCTPRVNLRVIIFIPSYLLIH